MSDRGVHDVIHNIKAERDPLGKSSKEPGSKLDAGKAPIYQGVLEYFPRSVQALAELSAYGANKYSWKGWEKVPDGVNRYNNALGRHIVKEAKEGMWDKEILNDPKYPAQVLHKTQIAWNAMAALELFLRELEGYKLMGVDAYTPPPPFPKDERLYTDTPVREQMDPIDYKPQTNRQAEYGK